MVATADLAQEQILDDLRRQVRRLEGAVHPEDDRPVSTGSPAIDRLLPRGGLPRGGLVEWLSSAAGGGAAGLAWCAAREACRDRGAIVVVDRGGWFYPPAAAAWGVSLEDLVLVRPRTEDEALWTAEQSLRCRGVAAVWCDLPRLDVTWQRRLQLAAETGGTLGLLLRPGRIRGQPSWTEVQFWVEPQATTDREAGRRLRVEVLRCRGGTGGRAVQLEIDPTGAMHPASDRHESHPVCSSADVAAAAAS